MCIYIFCVLFGAVGWNRLSRGGLSSTVSMCGSEIFPSFTFVVCFIVTIFLHFVLLHMPSAPRRQDESIPFFSFFLPLSAKPVMSSQQEPILVAMFSAAAASLCLSYHAHWERKSGVWVGIESRHPAWQASILPQSLKRQCLKLPWKKTLYRNPVRRRITLTDLVLHSRRAELDQASHHVNCTSG